VSGTDQPSEEKAKPEFSKSPNLAKEEQEKLTQPKKRLSKASKKSILLKEGDEQPKPKRKYNRRNTIEGSTLPKRGPKASRRDLTGTISSSGGKQASRP